MKKFLKFLALSSALAALVSYAAIWVFIRKSPDRRLVVGFSKNDLVRWVEDHIEGPVLAGMVVGVAWQIVELFREARSGNRRAS